MPLQSQLLKDNTKLKDCLESHANHIVPGARGDHVKLVQQALMILGAGTVTRAELLGGVFGPTTVQCVANFKGPPRNIVNRSYQSKPDNIVGIMTIGRLDKEMFDFENRPQPPSTLFSLLVSVTEAGEVHDHERCPTRPYATSPGADGHAQHKGSPIFPKGGGRKINIWGEGETRYLGFEDFATYDKGPFLKPARPLTRILPSRCASDICIRSSPLSRITAAEIQRIAQPNCRFTYASNIKWISASMRQFIASMGRRLEAVFIPDPNNAKDGMDVIVMDCDPSASWRIDLLSDYVPVDV